MVRRSSPAALRSLDLGIDIGSANLVVASARHGLLFDEPTCVALESKGGRVAACGYEAAAVGGKTADRLRIVHPFARSRPTDPDALHSLLMHMIDSVRETGASCRSAFVAISPLLSASERSLLQRIVSEIGISEVSFVEGIVAASHFTRRVRDSEKPVVMVDIGAEISSWGLITCGELTEHHTWEFGTRDFASEFCKLMERRYGLLLAQSQAESVMISLGCRGWNYPGLSAKIHAKSKHSGVPVAHTVWAGDVIDAISGFVFELSERLQRFLKSLPESVMRNLVESGVELCGGGSMIPSLESEVASRIGLPVVVGSAPLHAVALGAAQRLIPG